MPILNDGGPAFPRQATRIDYGNRGVEYCEPQDGMKLRDYFVAHAPAEPQPWFQPDMPERPAPVYVHSASCGCVECESPTNWREVEAYDKERAKQRLVQWPYAWAAAQIAERERPR